MKKERILLDLIKSLIALLLSIMFLHDAFTIKSANTLFSVPRLSVGMILLSLALLSLFNLFKNIKNTKLMECIYVVMFIIITIPMIKCLYPIKESTIILQSFILIVCLLFYILAYLTIKEIIKK